MQSLQQIVRRVAAKELTLQEQARHSLSERDHLVKDLGEQNRLISRKDEVLKTLQSMQVKAQAQNKGIIEDLLSSLIQEVLPQKDDRIVLTSSMKNNRASLDIDVLSEGHLENVSEDKGGSIANIVAMGLRFIVLARHPNRRVLFLDEADCHLREEYIPAFASVMHQLAIKMGIQVIFISHHPKQNFTGFGRVIELFQEKDMTYSRVISEEPALPDGYEAPDSAFRYLRLKNYGPHQNLLVELSPGVNILTGQVDLGKSKLIQALVDLSGNSAHERRIYRDATSFAVEVGLEAGMSLHWTYQRNGSKKHLMQLKDEEGDVIESSDTGTGVPDWLHTYLAMAPVNGENIHFHSQKNPSYLLSSDITSIERAQLLPLGRESRDVMRMIHLFNGKLSAARQDSKRLEKELNKHENRIAAMSLVIDNPVDPELLFAKCDAMVSAHDKIAKLGSLLSSIEKNEALCGVYQVATETLDEEPVKAVTLRVDPVLVEKIDRIQSLSTQLTSLANIADIRPALRLPALSNLEGIAHSGARIRSLANAAQQLSQLKDLAPLAKPILHDLDKITGNATRLGDLAKTLSQVQIQMQETDNNKRALATAKAKLIEQMGGLCPTCEQPFGDHQHD